VDVTDAIDGITPRIHHKPKKPIKPIEIAMGIRIIDSISMATRPTIASVMSWFQSQIKWW
jgi:hypothetical protein